MKLRNVDVPTAFPTLGIGLVGIGEEFDVSDEVGAKLLADHGPDGSGRLEMADGLQPAPAAKPRAQGGRFAKKPASVRPAEVATKTEQALADDEPEPPAEANPTSDEPSAG